MDHATPRHRMRRRPVPRALVLGLGAVLTAGTVVVVSMLPADAATTAGLDVSHHKGSITWTSIRSAGFQFAYIKATEGTTFTDPKFSANYLAAYRANVIRGAYHFARPDRSSGTAQANFFASHGGAWSADSRTLPGAVDLEYNPYGASCYGLSQSQMRSWISSFLNRYYARTGRYAVIYTSTSWWKLCTGNYSGYASHHPLWVARFASSVGALPAGWTYYTFWQYTETGRASGVSGNVDRDYFNGTRSRLLALANNTR